ncbi:MAG: hypothetical protein ACI8P0_001043 [Planctomycetaceae bacterium]
MGWPADVSGSLDCELPDFSDCRSTTHQQVAISIMAFRLRVDKGPLHPPSIEHRSLLTKRSLNQTKLANSGVFRVLD